MRPRPIQLYMDVATPRTPKSAMVPLVRLRQWQAKQKELESQVARLRLACEGLLKESFISYGVPFVEPYCFYCSADASKGQETVHEPTCPYVAAKKALES
jgi:hypothetical protein